MIYLTKKQLEEIAQQLAAISVKDSDFDETEHINDDDFVAIVQNGLNKRILIATLREGIAKGEKGDPGESAYELAVDEGYVGTLDEWLNSLKGEDGATGPQGPAGPGVPTGGSAGQVLAKSSGSDYATQWVNQSGGASALNDLSDVTLSSPSQNQVLKYDGTKWVNGAGGGGGASTLNDLTDVTVSSPAQGQVLSYDGTKWVNGPAGSGMNYIKCTSAQYAAWEQAGTLQSDILYIIVDTSINTL